MWEHFHFHLVDGNVGDTKFFEVDLNIFEANNDQKPEVNTLFMPRISLVSIPYKPGTHLDYFMQSLSNGMYKNKLKKLANYFDRKSFIVEIGSNFYVFGGKGFALPVDENIRLSKFKLNIFAVDIDDDDDSKADEDEVLIWVRYVDERNDYRSTRSDS